MSAPQIYHLESGKLFYRNKWWASMRASGAGPGTIGNWRDECIWLGRPIRFERLRIAIDEQSDGEFFGYQRDRLEYLYSVEDLETIKAHQASGTIPGAWPSTNEVVALGIGIDRLKKCKNKSEVSRRGVRMHNGRPRRANEWDPSFVAQLLASDKKLAEVDREKYATDQEAKAEFDVAASSLGRWHEKGYCRYIGRALDRFEIEGRWFTACVDLELIKAATVPIHEKWVDPADGSVWYPVGYYGTLKKPIAEQVITKLIKRVDRHDEPRRGLSKIGRPVSAPGIRGKEIPRLSRKGKGVILVVNHEDMMRYMGLTPELRQQRWDFDFNELRHQVAGTPDMRFAELATLKTVAENTARIAANTDPKNNERWSAPDTIERLRVAKAHLAIGKEHLAVAKGQVRPTMHFNDAEKAIIAVLDPRQGKSTETIAAETGYRDSHLRTMLAALHRHGAIESTPDGYIRKVD